MYDASPLYPRPAYPHDGTKGRRKEARREVRGRLGTSSDEAPTLIQALDAVEQLRRIIDLASGGRYGLAIVRPTFEGESGQVALREHFTFGPGAGVVYTGSKLETSSQVHEPVTDTRRRELQLRRATENWRDYA